MTLEIEVSGDGLCSLWPEVLIVEPGSPAHRFKLNGTLYMNLVSPGGDPLYSVFVNLERLYLRSGFSITLSSFNDLSHLLLEKQDLCIDQQNFHFKLICILRAL